MSDAKVKFYDEGYEPTTPETAARFGFCCPKSGKECLGLLIAGRTSLKRDGQNQNGGVAQWDFDGNAAAPTFTPSIYCQSCPGKWHGFIKGGRCVDAAHQDEPEPTR